MSEESTTTLFTESPASWNTRYVSPDGFTCQLTLRGDNGKELLERANSALAHLREEGCIPSFGFPKNNQQESEITPETFKNTESDENPVICPIHNVELKRWQKKEKSG